MAPLVSQTTKIAYETGSMLDRVTDLEDMVLAPAAFGRIADGLAQEHLHAQNNSHLKLTKIDI